jgi:hypothetical protein
MVAAADRGYFVQVTSGRLSRRFHVPLKSGVQFQGGACAAERDRVGYLTFGTQASTAEGVEALRRGLREQGYIEGRTSRWSIGSLTARKSAFSRSRLSWCGLKIDVLFAPGPALPPAMNATKTIHDRLRRDRRSCRLRSCTKPRSTGRADRRRGHDRGRPRPFSKHGGSEVAVARHPDILLPFGDLLHQSRLRDLGHSCEILNRTHRNVWEGEAIRRHAVDQ